jgi:hypothetical protein
MGWQPQSVARIGKQPTYIAADLSGRADVRCV